MNTNTVFMLTIMKSLCHQQCFSILRWPLLIDDSFTDHIPLHANLIKSCLFAIACIGIKSLLPAGVHSISNKEGVHGAISYCFRQHQSTLNLSSSEQIDLGFETLKYLNTYGQKLKERYNQRVKNSSPDVYSNAVYHVGQTVCHTDSSCRCVVIGKLSKPI